MKAGVMLIDLIDVNRQQMSLLDTPQSEAERERIERLMATLDELNQRMERGTVKLGMPMPAGRRSLKPAQVFEGESSGACGILGTPSC